MKMNEDIRPFKFSERDKARHKWQMYFPDIMLGDVADNLLSVLTQTVVIDIVKLDKRLENLYPEEWETHSMDEIITRHYGERANELVKSMIFI